MSYAQYDTLDQRAPRANAPVVTQPEYMDWETFDRLCYLCFKATCNQYTKGGNQWQTN